jgi:hypothetical protein
MSSNEDDMKQEPTIHTSNSKAEVDTRVAELVAQGWTSLPADDPERALRGFVVFRYVSRHTGIPVTEEAMRTEEAMAQDIVEETQVFQYNLFGKPLYHDHAVVTAEELIAAMKADPTYYIADNPMARLLGFVWYKVDEGVSRVRRTTLTAFKSSSDADRAFIQSERERLKDVVPPYTGPQPAEQ